MMQGEFAKKYHVPETTLITWQKCGLIQPVGFTEDKIPLYSETMADRVVQIQKFQEMGYNLDAIQKIFKKVGLPKSDMDKESRSGKSQFITVGNLAERVGISPRTIKHWEDKGIIEPDTRSEGGFRLYSETYVYLCQLIRDLQLFGYSLEEIKAISDYFREFLTIQKDFKQLAKSEIGPKIETMLKEIQILFDKMKSFKEGIQRWEDLLRKKKRELTQMKNQIDRQNKPKKES